VDDTSSRAPCRLHDVSGAVHIDRTSEHRVWSFSLGAVEHHRTAFGTVGEHFWVEDIADDHFYRKTRNKGCTHDAPNEHTYLRAILQDEAFDKPSTEESRRPGDKDARTGKNGRHYSVACWNAE
jgi:hypothetical protein